MTKEKQIRSQALKYLCFKGHFGENVKTMHEMRTNAVFADHLGKNAVSRIYKKKISSNSTAKRQPNLKLGKESEQAFLQRETHMTNQPMKRSHHISF